MLQPLGKWYVPSSIFCHRLRRQGTDLSPEFEQDARVLNGLTGHLDSATRERIYQDLQNEVVRARAARARGRMRSYFGGEGPRKEFARKTAPSET